MSGQTGIEWTEATWNPVTGCSKVSPGCAHCYAERIELRFGRSLKPWTPENAAENIVLHPERLDQPLRWRRPRMVFVNSMSDLFHKEVPFAFVFEVFRRMRQAERHTFQVLTKRPERAAEFFDWLWDRSAIWPDSQRDEKTTLPNVWIGVSIENARHTWRADILREIPAAVRFISAEPLLGSLFDDGPPVPTADPADWRKTPRRKALDLSEIDWLIAGGESGPHARTMDPEWARELRDACLAVCGDCLTEDDYPVIGSTAPACGRPAFFFKQWGGRTPKANGRLLDGREWNEMPAARQAVPA